MNKRKLTYGILIAFLFTCICCGNANSEQDVVISGLQYTNFRNAIADLIGGQTIVKIMPNSENKNELFIVNDRSYSVLVEFYDATTNIFYEHIAIPNHKTYLGNVLELLESPLKVDYHQYLDNTFLSTLTATGLKEEDLPSAGHIRIILGNKKAMAVGAIACFGAAIDFGVSTAELVSGKKVSGLNNFLKYIFLYDALRDPGLINSCTTILVNMKSFDSDSIKRALINIKDEYCNYLEGRFKEIMGKYLYILCDFKSAEGADFLEAAVSNSIKNVKAIGLISKFGNISTPISAIMADIKRDKEIVIASQIYANNSDVLRPNFAKDISPKSALGRKLKYLIDNRVYTISELYDDSNALNPKSHITSINFIYMLKDIFLKIYEKKMSYELYGKIVVASGDNAHEDLRYINAIIQTYHVFKDHYGDNFGKLYPFGSASQKSRRTKKAIKYLREYRDEVASTYGTEEATILYKMYPVFSYALFKDVGELDKIMTKSQAISILYEYMKFHEMRIDSINQ